MYQTISTPVKHQWLHLLGAESRKPCKINVGDIRELQTGLGWKNPKRSPSSNYEIYISCNII